MKQFDRTTQTSQWEGRQTVVRETDGHRDRWEYRQTVVNGPRKQTDLIVREGQKETGRQADCKRETDRRTQKFQNRGEMVFK